MNKCVSHNFLSDSTRHSLFSGLASAGGIRGLSRSKLRDSGVEFEVLLGAGATPESMAHPQTVLNSGFSAPWGDTGAVSVTSSGAWAFLEDFVHSPTVPDSCFSPPWGESKVESEIMFEAWPTAEDMVHSQTVSVMDMAEQLCWWMELCQTSPCSQMVLSC